MVDNYFFVCLNMSMKNKLDLRSDYKLKRNKKIYEEYINTNASFNILAKKYDLSPQRIRFIIEDLKNKGLEKRLKVSDKKTKRESFKDIGVALREQGKLDTSIKIFDDILAWDDANNNLRGKIDVLGHKKINLTLLSDNASSDSIKLKYLEDAEKCMKESFQIAKSQKGIPLGSKATQKVHMASLLFRLSALLDDKNRAVKQREAIEYLDSALQNLPGSKAHRAWPLSIKANILHALGQTQKALEALYEAQQCLYDGYDGEIKGADQGEMKLRVWSSGVSLALAKIYIDMHKPILAEIQASAVTVTPDPDKILVARKKEAKKILSSLQK